MLYNVYALCNFYCICIYIYCICIHNFISQCFVFVFLRCQICIPDMCTFRFLGIINASLAITTVRGFGMITEHFYM